MNDKVHVFEQLGLGKAPFVFDSFFEGQTLATQTNPMTTSCNYCGTAIVNCFRLKSADGKFFIVGSECVKKTGDKGLIKRVNEELKEKKSAIRRERFKIAQEKEWAENKVRYQESLNKWEAEFSRVKPALISKPHPNAYFAKQGKTLLDYVMYFIRESESEDWKRYHIEAKLQILYKVQVLVSLREAGANI